MLAFLTSQFPEVHETFILREFCELKRKGVPFRIYSLKPCRDPIVHPEAASLAPQTAYLPFLLSLRVVASCLDVAARRPARLLRVLSILARHALSAPVASAKTLVALPKIIAFALDMEASGVVHVHAHWATVPATAALLVSVLTGLTFSFTAHAWDIYLPNPLLAEKMNRARLVVTCTGYNARHLKAVRDFHGRTPVEVVRHGLNLAGFVPRGIDTRDPRSVLAVGRLVEQKGFEWLLRAIAALRSQGCDLDLTIAGEGPDRGRLTALARSLGIADRVRLPGLLSQERLAGLYASARVFALPCVVAADGNRDGIPNVLIEAMATGLPVVASPVSGVPELAAHEETGLLARERDAHAIALEILRLVADTALWKRCSARGRERVEGAYDVEKNVGELVRLMRAQGVIPAETASQGTATPPGRLAGFGAEATPGATRRPRASSARTGSSRG